MAHIVERLYATVSEKSQGAAVIASRGTWEWVFGYMLVRALESMERGTTRCMDEYQES